MEETTKCILKFGDQNSTMDISNSESDWNKIAKMFRENRAVRGKKNSQNNKKGKKDTKKRKG